MNAIYAFISAVLFGIGLAVSGMIDPAKVQGFLDVTGKWDPSLAFVMGGALVVTTLGYAWLRARVHGIGGVTLQWPKRNELDAKLIGGSALFGAGWGIAGFCPGPAIGSLALGGAQIMTFVAIMVLSLLITARLVSRAK